MQFAQMTFVRPYFLALAVIGLTCFFTLPAPAAQSDEQTFYDLVASGDIEEAAQLAERVVRIDRGNADAHLVLGARALKRQQWGDARAQFERAAHGTVNDLTGTLLAAWCAYGAGDADGAINAIDKLSGPDWYDIFKHLHAGLIADLDGDEGEADERFASAFAADGALLRVMQAYAGFLSRNGARDRALRMYQDYEKRVPRYPLTLEGLALLERGTPLPRLVETAQEGAAEVLYGIGAAWGRRDAQATGLSRGLVYLQLALYLEPDHALALVSLADLYEGMNQYEQAIRTLARVPVSSPLKTHSDIQTAIDLDKQDSTGEAIKILESVIAGQSASVEAVVVLGNIQRERKRYRECAETYSKAIGLIAAPTNANWTTFYFRAICLDRAKEWDRAEADFKKALELFPDQPNVLNYLAYVWVDRGVHLDESLDMLKRAVEQRPDDGYIIDSLGWAYYRLGDIDEALKNTERAVELKPEDPAIHDHLGDVYRTLGRVSDARLQWLRARELNPEPDDLKKIEEKLANGGDAK
jgi:tetratricopeptide (TPR) repeat protein